MKRDMELIRELFMAIEADVKNTTLPASQLNLKSDWAEDDVYYHLVLMTDAGFVESEPVKSLQRIHNVLIKRMTWEGHEFLDKARSESIWSTAKETITKKGLSLETVGFGVLTQVLASVTKQILALN
jgi:Hypothetical protein (DUF2513)